MRGNGGADHVLDLAVPFLRTWRLPVRTCEQKCRAALRGDDDYDCDPKWENEGWLVPSATVSSNKGILYRM
jgi:hypothetical protein